MTELYCKQGQRVEFNIDDDLKGFGKIVGIALNKQPFIGATYIVEPEEPINCESYKYSHIVVNETQFKTTN